MTPHDHGLVRIGRDRVLLRLWLSVLVVAGVSVANTLAADAAPPPLVSLEKSIERVDGFVGGDLTFSAPRPEELTSVSVEDTLEAKFKPGSSPGLPAGSTPGWFEIGTIDVSVPSSIQVDEDVVFPYQFDLCRAQDFEGATQLRNVAVAVAQVDGEVVELTARASVDEFDPQCPHVRIDVVDQEGSTVSDVTVQLSSAVGDVFSCTSAVDGACEIDDLFAGTYEPAVLAVPSGFASTGCALWPEGPLVTEIELRHGDDVVVTCFVEQLFGEGSCVGEGACEGLTGSVGDFSCIGDLACIHASSDIGDDSCVGSEACGFNTGDVAAGSCLGSRACHTNSGDLGTGSCHGDRACEDASSQVGDGSCLGANACLESVGTSIGAGSCVGDVACFDNAGLVGDGSCQEGLACGGNTGDIADDSCIGDEACSFNSGDVSDGSCIGQEACQGNSGDVGNGSCIGFMACEGNEAAVPDGSCIGEKACAVP